MRSDAELLEHILNQFKTVQPTWVMRIGLSPQKTSLLKYTSMLKGGLCVDYLSLFVRLQLCLRQALTWRGPPPAFDSWWCVVWMKALAHFVTRAGIVGCNWPMDPVVGRYPGEIITDGHTDQTVGLSTCPTNMVFLYLVRVFAIVKHSTTSYWLISQFI